MKRPQIIQIRAIESWDVSKCTPTIKRHFENYKSAIEAIRKKFATEVATTINGSISYKNFNKLSKVLREFEKICEDWAIESGNMAELSRKVVYAFRLRDNIKQYTDFLIRLNFDVPPVTFFKKYYSRLSPNY